MEIKRDILWRVYCCFLGIILLGVFVLGKAVYIQRIQGKYWVSLNDSMHQRIQQLDAGRGTIYSEDGQMLSTSLPQFDIYMDLMADGLREKNGKRFKENIDSFAISLANFFNDKSKIQYAKDLQSAFNKKNRYYAIRKKLSFSEYKIFRQFPLVKLGRNKSGIIVEESSKRVSPFGLLANRTIGLSREHVASNGKIKKQNVGLEKSYDSFLTGQMGQRLVRYVAGAAIPIDGFKIEPEDGKDIYSTIDVNMQDISEQALLAMMEKSEAQNGTCILMETKTGKIKAIANLGRRPDGAYWEDDNYALKVTEPGSTIKLATLLAVLDKGVVKLNDNVEVGSAGRAQVGPRMVNDAERQPKPIETVKECFAHSSNVGMSKLAFKAFGKDPAEFKKYLKRYHLNDRSPIDLKDIPKPVLAPLDNKRGGLMNMLTVSFGYAINVSPLHTLTLYNAIANNGKMMKPYLVNSIQRKGIVVEAFQPQVMDEQICGSEVVNAAREAMEAVVTEGTARPAFINMPFKVAGKTGTAHVADGRIKYSSGVYQASFVGYFPADNPQYSCIVVIRTKPHAAIHYGGQLGAPVFREVATKVYAMYVDQKTPTASYAAQKDSSDYFYAGKTADIKDVFKVFNVNYKDSAKSNEWTVVGMANQQPILKTNRITAKQMPNVRGMGLKDALFLLEKFGLKIKTNGRGKVVEQSIAPGTALIKGVEVMLNLG